MAKSKPRRNVTVKRGKDAGDYFLYGISSAFIGELSAAEWKDLGLKPLRKGETCRLDLQASGIPKRKAVRK